MQLSLSGTTKAIRFIPCRYLYCTAQLKAQWHVIHLYHCGIKRLQQVRGILFKNRCCILPTVSLHAEAQTHNPILNRWLLRLQGIKGRMRGRSFEIHCQKEKSSKELWDASACVHACVHQLMHKDKRERSSKVDAWAGHYFVCFIPHKLEVDLVRNCGCSSRKEGKQTGGEGNGRVSHKMLQIFRRKRI